jgi:hypothetical protein
MRTLILACGLLLIWQIRGTARTPLPLPVRSDCPESLASTTGPNKATGESQDGLGGCRVQIRGCVVATPIPNRKKGSAAAG